MLKNEWLEFLQQKNISEQDGAKILEQMGKNRNDFSLEHAAEFDKVRSSQDTKIVVPSASSTELSTDVLKNQLDLFTQKNDSSVQSAAKVLAEMKRKYPKTVVDAARKILADEGWNPQQAWETEISGFMSDLLVF